MRYCGRMFSDEEITWIRSLIEDCPELSRRKLSERICLHLDWRKFDGELKAMSCRVALLRMERDGIVKLPALLIKRGKPSGKKRQWTLLANQQPEICGKAGQFDLHFEQVTKSTSALWNEFIDRYHYLGYKPLPGAQLRYFIKAEGRILALLGFGASAWKTAPRDVCIGWNAEQRKRNLHLVINNARFLILGWVRVKYLASRILAIAARRLADDWQERYKYRPVLLETFVDKQRFRGTCYKAAGWIYVGDTKGRGKLDVEHECKLSVKSIWLKPLEKDFRGKLIV